MPVRFGCAEAFVCKLVGQASRLPHLRCHALGVGGNRMQRLASRVATFISSQRVSAFLHIPYLPVPLSFQLSDLALGLLRSLQHVILNFLPESLVIVACQSLRHHGGLPESHYNGAEGERQDHAVP